METRSDRILWARGAVRQFAGYAALGFAINAAGYGAYLGLTELRASPHAAMSFVYACGALLGFFSYRKLVFTHQGALADAGLKYLAAQVGGYGLNYVMISFFVGKLGIAHQFVQAAAIVTVAVFLFLACKFFVFAHSAPQGGRVKP
jgi:putative flippase GtrA